MSIKAISWAWDQQLKAVPKLILLALADHANDEDYTCWPSITHIAKKTGLGRSTVIDNINKLADTGYVRRTSVGNISGATTTYQVLVPSPATGLASPAAGLGLVQQPDGSSPAAGHGTVIEPSITTRKAKHPIPHDWKPDESSYQWAINLGATRELVDQLVPEFIAYFTATKETRVSWDATFVCNPVVKKAIGRFTHHQSQGTNYAGNQRTHGRRRTGAEILADGCAGAFKK